ncbi:MAG: beta-eliminating lyase-related protein, partial [Pseudomonadota bacterium]
STHMDGTRFANALAATNASPAEMSWRAGVDVLCLGATKCGAMAAEAVILFDPAKAREFELRRKRGGHLFSKMRFVAAQMEAWLADGLWLRLAAHANAMAARLREGMAARGVKIVHPGTGPAANLFFVELSAGQHAALQAAGMRYYASAAEREGRHSARIVASFATREEDVEAVLAAL